MKKIFCLFCLLFSCITFVGCWDVSEYELTKQLCTENSWNLIKDNQWSEICLFEDWRWCNLQEIEDWNCFLIENESDFGQYSCSESNDEYLCSEASFEDDFDFKSLESWAINIWNAKWWLTPQEALDYMKSTKDLVIIDTRDIDNKPNGFKWALEIPYNQLVKRIEEIPQWRPVLLHCWGWNVAPKWYVELLKFNPEIPELSYIAGVPLFDEYNEWVD